VSFDLSAENCRSVYLPPGIAHGFQTLSEYSDVSYAMTDVYRPEAGAGLRWNDSRLNISWPIDELIINERDRDYSDVDDAWLRSLNWNQALS
jgi:dTDP-4-dehydrorhamnose 3,5-epimerase